MRDQGFVYFQGFFFRRPEMMGTHDIPANRLNYIRMLQEVSGPELNLPGLEKLIKEEASICYRLLRYLNSAVFGFRKEIHSVRHALSLLGERDLRKWVRLIAAVGAGQDKTSDLVLSALARGRFCELLTPKVLHGESDLFLMGLLSLIDAMLECSMETVLEKIPLDSATKSARSPRITGRHCNGGANFRRKSSGDWGDLWHRRAGPPVQNRRRGGPCARRQLRVP